MSLLMTGLAHSDAPAARWRTIKALASMLIVLGLGWALPSPAFASNSAGWRSQSLPAGAGDLSAVTFANASDGWAVGETFDSKGNFTGSVILATSNGGATWKTQYTDAGDGLSAVAFANASDGWAVGASYASNGNMVAGIILATTNGGATWSTQYSGPAANLTGVVFVNASDGWVVGPDFTLATTNGGATWKTQPFDAWQSLGGPNRLLK